MERKSNFLKWGLLVLIAPWALILLLSNVNRQNQHYADNRPVIDYWVDYKFDTFALPDTLPLGIRKFLAAYPGSFKGATYNALIWPDDSLMEFDDGNIYKDYYKQLKEGDMEDMLKIPYTVGYMESPPVKNFNPGVIRYEPFFFKMYGGSKEAVVARLQEVQWVPGEPKKPSDPKKPFYLKATGVNDVDGKLQAVTDSLMKLPHLHKYLVPPGGTFNWRNIALTKSVSMHSFGIAIDICVKYSNYWRWDHPGVQPEQEKDIPMKNSIPQEIAHIFEHFGFIWGGKWYHYDTMHFEYRPELTVKIKE